MFTDETRQAIDRSAQIAAQDMTEEQYSDPELMAEVAIDANRLTTCGYPDADAEVMKLVLEHGYEAVIAEAAKITRYA